MAGSALEHGIPSPEARDGAAAPSRMTPLRQATLDLLGQGNRAWRAYDLIPRLEAACGRRFQAQTIYRTLDFLLNEGLILRIESWNAFIVRPDAVEHQSALMLLCDDCGGARVVNGGGVPGALDEVTRAHGFRMARTVVEVRGTCAACCEAPVEQAAGF